MKKKRKAAKKPVSRNVPQRKYKKRKQPIKSWRGVRKQTVKRKRREKVGRITDHRLFGKAISKYGNALYASSISLINRHRNLDKWADEIEAMKSIKGLKELIERQDKGRKTKPFKCTVIVIQRNREYPHRHSVTSYPSGAAMKITEPNVKGFVVGVLRHHEENIRQQIIRRGYRDQKYDEGNFKAWHVPYIDIVIHYKLKSK